LKSRVRILVVDDEPLIRRAFQKLFQDPRFEVLFAEDGAAGLKLWNESSPDFVFLDVIMPVLNGWEVLEQKKSWLGTRVYVMSAFTGDLAQKKIWIEKIDGFLQKPFEDVMKIKKWVEDALQS